MEFIIKIANKFVAEYLTHTVTDFKKIIDDTKSQLYEINDHLDKIKFLNIILEANNIAYDKHKPKCNSPDKCIINFAHESINYFLLQELDSLGIQINENVFTSDEKNIVESKLDKALKDLEELKMGHQIIYDDLLQEINELKALYFLGKKSWYQLLAGKCLSMVASGIISETVSKEIINAFTPALTKLL